MRGMLVSIDAWSRVTNSRVTVRVGAARNAATLGADGFVWEPALTVLPRLSMQLCDDDMTGQLMMGAGTFTVNVGALKRVADPLRLDFAGATARIYSGDGNRLAVMKQEFVGRIVGGTPNADNGLAQLSVQVDKTIVDVPLLNLTYGGGGGADGDVEIRGRNKPASFGRPINIAPTLIDSVNAVYQWDGYGNSTGLAGVYEDLASFGASLGDFATYAALVAANIPAGRFATCIVQGMFRLGAPATGAITCDPICGGGTPGTMVLRWLRQHAAVVESRIRVSDFTSIDTQLQALVGVVPPVSFWTDGNDSVLEVWQRLCASCNCVPLLMFDGTVGMARVPGGPVALTPNRQGGTPTVTAWQSSDAPTPWWKQKTSAEESFYVNGPGEIDYEDDLNDLGDYVPGETYRQGNIVRLPLDGRRYFYINPSASAIAPPNLAYWDIWEEAPEATAIRYPGGATLADKEPADSGSTRNRIRGDWIASTVYLSGDVVQRSGSSYSAIIDHQSTATNGPPGANWVLFASQGVQGQRGEGGISALSATLSNEAFVVPTDFNGLPQEITSNVGNGQMQVFIGQIEVTSSCTFRAEIPFNLAVTINAAGAYKSTGLYGDTGYALLIATYNDQTITKRLDAVKSRGGKDGSSAPLITLTSTHLTFRYGADGTIIAQTTRLIAFPQNSTSPVEWRLLSTSGTVLTGWTSAAGQVAPGAISRALDALNVEIDAGQYNAILTSNAITGIIYEVRLANTPAIVDRVSIMPLKDGTNGRNGTNGAPGAPGVDGKTTYVHFAYADSPNGSVNFTTGPPQDRAFQGSYTDTTEADSPDATKYTWTPYKGPPAFGLTGSGDTYVGGNSLIKQSSGEWGSGGGYSTEGFRGGVQCSFVAGQGSGCQIMAGLNSDPATNNDYRSIDYAWFLDSSGNAQIYQSGAHVGNYVGGFGFGTFQVVYDGQFVRYLYNAFEYHRVDVGRDQLFYFDAALNGPPGTRLNAIGFAAAGANGRNGTDGLNGTNGAPGAPGANGQPSFFHTAYANSPDGSVDFTTTAANGRKYLGTYSDATPADSGNYQVYTWQLVKGEDGLNGSNGIPGAPGKDGRVSYTHIAYANGPAGQPDFSTNDPAGRAYIGLYEDTVEADSGDAARYTWSLVKGEAGTSPYVLSIDATAIVVNATYAGLTKDGQLPRSTALRVRQGTTDVTGSVQIGVSTSANIAANYGGGFLNVTAANSDGYVEVTASVGGVVVDTKRLTITRKLDPAPPQTATGATTTVAGGDPSSTTYPSTPTGAIMTIQTPANGQLPVTIFGSCATTQVTGSNVPRSYALGLKLMYRLSGPGGAWSDIGGEAVSTTATWDNNGETEPGDLYTAFTITLAGSTAYEFGLLRRKAGGNGFPQYVENGVRIGA